VPDPAAPRGGRDVRRPCRSARPVAGRHEQAPAQAGRARPAALITPLAAPSRGRWHAVGMDHAATGTLHHIELWVPDLVRADACWGWLLGELGYEPFQEWPDGRSWRSGPTYIVVEQSPARTAFRHDRHRPGLNHLAFYVASSEQVEVLAAESVHHGWRLMFAPRHPFAG